LFGLADFSKNSSERVGVYLPLSGIPIYYYRCSNCGFIFSVDFDGFSPDDFKECVYNDEYTKVDPDWLERRPKSTAELIANSFGDFRNEISILDFGAGNGHLSKLLREKGFSVTSYDPMVEKHAARPKGKFDLVLCIEVLEHVTDPLALARDLAGLRKEGGLIFFSTLLQPTDIEKIKLDWWYLGPRNGHISAFSKKSLTICWKSVGLKVVSANHHLHAAYEKIPGFAAHLFAPK